MSRALQNCRELSSGFPHSGSAWNKSGSVFLARCGEAKPLSYTGKAELARVSAVASLSAELSKLSIPSPNNCKAVDPATIG
jgi:hypothetical protein